MLRQVIANVLAKCLVPAILLAQRRLVVEPQPRLPRRPDPMPRPQRMDAYRVSAVDKVATTSIEQVFANPGPVRLEADNVFSLLPDSQIDKLEIEVNGQDDRG